MRASVWKAPLLEFWFGTLNPTKDNTNAPDTMKTLLITAVLLSTLSAFGQRNPDERPRPEPRPFPDDHPVPRPCPDDRPGEPRPCPNPKPWAVDGHLIAMVGAQVAINHAERTEWSCPCCHECWVKCSQCDGYRRPTHPCYGEAGIDILRGSRGCCEWEHPKNRDLCRCGSAGTRGHERCVERPGRDERRLGGIQW